MKGLTHILFCLSFVTANAQRPWTANQCMQYAVTHNHEVRLQHITLDNYQTEKYDKQPPFFRLPKPTSVDNITLVEPLTPRPTLTQMSARSTTPIIYLQAFLFLMVFKDTTICVQQGPMF